MDLVIDDAEDKIPEAVFLDAVINGDVGFFTIFDLLAIHLHIQGRFIADLVLVFRPGRRVDPQFVHLTVAGVVAVGIGMGLAGADKENDNEY